MGDRIPRLAHRLSPFSRLSGSAAQRLQLQPELAGAKLRVVA